MKPLYFQLAMNFLWGGLFMTDVNRGKPASAVLDIVIAFAFSLLAVVADRRSQNRSKGA